MGKRHYTTLTNEKNEQHLYIKEIMDKQKQQLEYMRTQTNQIGIAHLIVTWPNDVKSDSSNKIISASLNALRKTMGNHQIKTQAGWVRECSENHQDSDSKPHYHIELFFDAEKIQSGFKIADNLNALITKRISKDKTSHYVRCISPQKDCQAELNGADHGALKIRCNRPNAAEQIENALSWLSYQAKADTKDQKNIRAYGFSQVPENPTSKE